MKAIEVQMQEQNKKDLMTAKDYKSIVRMIVRYSKQKNFNKEVAKRLTRIVSEENSFLMGMTETFASNLDYIFRFVYLISYLLFLAVVIMF